MDKFLETVMDFINENTTLLIIICVFLIFVLIGYLIDNSIKTRRMEKNLILENYTDNPDGVEETTEEIVETKVEEKEEPIPEPVIEEKVEEPEIEEPAPVEEPVETEEEIDTPIPEVVEEPVLSNELTVDPKVNDILLRDFANNNANVEPEVEKKEESREVQFDDTVTLNPIKDVVPIVEEPKKESVYKNDKKLSDIFKKKETPTVEPKLETTADYSNELDRILQKLNDVTGESSKDSTLDETTDFTNMF